MSEELMRQSIIDEEHLKLLSLGYMISAATAALFSLFGLMYMLMGIAMGAAMSHSHEFAAHTGQAPPAFIGWMVAGIGLVIFLMMIVLAAVKFRAGSCIKKRKSRTFCMVVAGISCLEFPYGTVLGVFTFIVLGRESVARLFNSSIAPDAAA